MQAIYYYPTKLSITPDEAEHEEVDSYDTKWKYKAEQLQARRWKRVHAIERKQKEVRQKRLAKVRQKQWLQRHGWPRVSQPMV